MPSILSKALSAIGALYRKYPARATSYVVAAIVAVASAVGFGVDSQTIAQVVGLVLPILLGGEAIHRNVSPVKAKK